jgi:hypothetical protein
MEDDAEQWETYRKPRNIALAVSFGGTPVLWISRFVSRFLGPGHDYVFALLLMDIHGAIHPGIGKGLAVPTMRKAIRLQVAVLKHGIIGEVLCTLRPEEVCESLERE